MNGEEISDAAFAAALTRTHEAIEKLLAEGILRAHPTFFECVTAIAFLHFAQAGAQFGIFETGLGGRLDATNVVLPKVSVITRIDFDHENFLGHSLREIASEKAGIIKPGVPVVLAEQQPDARAILLAKATELDSPAIETSAAFTVESEQVELGCIRALVRENTTGKVLTLAPQLAGRFQMQNALNAVAAARLLPLQGFSIDDATIETGIRTAVWPGRIEKIRSSPDIYLDGAHNPSAARELAAYLAENLVGRKIIMIFGALRDKAVDEIAGILFPCAHEVIFTEPNSSRAISAAQLARIAGHHTSQFTIIPKAESALDTALAHASPTDAIFITGSLYLVGQLRRYAAAPGA
jgi:dihydrofolate synthase/folylpolyglutamate synthase